MRLARLVLIDAHDKLQARSLSQPGRMRVHLTRFAFHTKGSVLAPAILARGTSQLIPDLFMADSARNSLRSTPGRPAVIAFPPSPCTGPATAG